ncbi:MAG: tetratricopeptide repeat protein [Kiritimatiellia bacterium]|nr:tetratricopeptide repeat protein [Kiritimatiellia bacterium]
MGIMTARSLVGLLVMAVLCGQSHSADPVSQPTNAPAKSGARAEDLLWSSAQESLKNAQYKEACEKFIQFARRYHNDPQYREALFYQGLCEMKMGKETQAERTWEQVLRLEMLEKVKSKALLLTLEQLAGYYGQKNKENDEKKILDQLLTEYPDNPVTVSAHTQAAEARLKKSDYAGALVFYRAVEKKLSENDLKNLELAETMTAKKGARNPPELLKAANESFEKDNVEQAIKLYQTLLKQGGNSSQAAEARTRLGWCFFLRQKYSEAESLWQEVIKKAEVKDEWVGESRWHLIQLLTGPQSKPDKAIELCDAQAKDFPGTFRGEQAMFIKAWLCWTRKDWTKAFRAFNDLVSAYPETAQHKPIQDYIRDCEQGIQNARGGKK